MQRPAPTQPTLPYPAILPAVAAPTGDSVTATPSGEPAMHTHLVLYDMPAICRLQSLPPHRACRTSATNTLAKTHDPWTAHWRHRAPCAPGNRPSSPVTSVLWATRATGGSSGAQALRQPQ